MVLLSMIHCIFHLWCSLLFLPCLLAMESVRAPFEGKPQTIPGKLELERYDFGGEGVAYHDSETLNLGSGKLNLKFSEPEASFRRLESVDISYTKKPRGKFKGDFSVSGSLENSGQLYVGWTVPGEWLKYTIDVQQSGTYRVGGHISAGKKDASFFLYVNATESMIKLDLPYTGSAHQWTTSSDLGELEFVQGVQTLTLRVGDVGGFNLDWLEFTLVTNEKSLSDGEDAAKGKFFNSQVLPLLKENCFECHSHKSGKAKGGLVLDSKPGWMSGGELGPVIVPGNPEVSLLLKAIKYQDEDLQMPPRNRLNAHQVAVFQQWIKEGAYDPRMTALEDEGNRQRISSEEVWSFQPVINPTVPVVSDQSWPFSDVDCFVLSRLEISNLNPMKDAMDATLIRRVYLDLTGLPPTPHALDRWLHQFVKDRETSLAALTDDLLNTPQFGERWARHWLDTVRYAESNGNNRNRVFRYAWRYRNWVIDAYNEDLPYDRFLKEQLSGDLMPFGSSEQRKKQRIATGFLAIGAKPYYPTIVPLDESEPDRAKYDWVAEQIDATMAGMMGLTAACARCHDHKFDPIPTRDYYALAGIFRSTEPRFGMYYHLFGVPEGQAQRDFLYDWNLLVLNEEILPQIKPLQEAYAPLAMEENRLKRRLDHLPRQMANIEDRIRMGLVSDPHEMEKSRNQLKSLREQMYQDEIKLSEVQKDKRLRKDSFNFKVDSAMGVEDSDYPSNVALRINGDHARIGPIIPRGFLSTLSFKGAPEKINPNQSGRLELAEWIAHPNNPLTARVAVNRIWYHLFGRGIVATLDNLGLSGETATHPKLLDHLAYIFVHQMDWSQKALIHYLVNSRVYQLSSNESHATPEHFEKDPHNTLYWKMLPRRWEAEVIRDSMLLVAGRLDTERPKGSPLTEFEYHAGITSRDLTTALSLIESSRRTIYVPTLRGHRHSLYDLFDYPDDETVNSLRNTSTVPTQSLYLMNNPVVMGYAASLAQRIQAERPDGNEKSRINHLYRLCFSRLPDQEEIVRDLGFLQTCLETDSVDRAWQQLAHSILISGEFLFKL